MATAAGSEEMAAAVEGFEKTTMAGLPVGRGLDEITAGAEEVMMLSVVGMAIGSVAAMAMGPGPVPETVSDCSVPAPDLQAPPMGHGSMAEHRFFPLIHACSPQVLATDVFLLGTTCCL